MKTLTLNNRTFLVWNVEEAAAWPRIHYYNDVPWSSIFYSVNGKREEISDLPPGTYSDLFLLSQVDEEIAAGMVRRLELNEECGYLDYETLIDKSISYCHKSALESFHSWLRANGVMTTENKEWIFVEQLTSK